MQCVAFSSEASRIRAFYKAFERKRADIQSYAPQEERKYMLSRLTRDKMRVGDYRFSANPEPKRRARVEKVIPLSKRKIKNDNRKRKQSKITPPKIKNNQDPEKFLIELGLLDELEESEKIF